MILNVAKNIGFCFGVSRAVKETFKIISSGKKCCTFGEIVHNPTVILRFKNLGGAVVDDIKDVPKGYTLVIRSHGVGIDVFKKIKELGLNFFDATCPFVKRIHKIVQKYSSLGFNVLIAGDENHCEVQGIAGNCLGYYYIFNNLKHLEGFFEEEKNKISKSIVVAQTTFPVEEWKKICELIKNTTPKFKIFDTICLSTYERQKETDVISKNSDIMIVVGGNNSSNSLKLKKICERNCETYFVDNPSKLRNILFKGDERVGVVSGASVPLEVVDRVKKFLNNYNVNEKTI